MARQAALLLLYVHGYEIPTYPVTNDFYRQALDLTLRGKREFTSAILAAMGGITRQQFSRFKILLKLSDEALDLADRHNLEEGLLRYVTNLEVEDHAEVIRHIVKFGLTVRQVQEMCIPRVDEEEEPTTQSKHFLQIIKFIRNLQTTNPEDFAKALLSEETDNGVARARIQSMRAMLDEIEKHL